MAKPVLLLITVTLIMFLSLSHVARVSAQGNNNIEFAFMDYWKLELPENVLFGENYTMRKGINFGVCGMDETVGNPELRISFKPNNESQILQIMDLGKEDGHYSTAWNRITGEENCFGGDVEYGIQKDDASPLVVIRNVDRIFFDSRGVQRCTVDVTPLQYLNRLEVEFDIGFTEGADIRILSPNGELSGSGDMVRFYVDNPSRGASHSFTLELEITPKKKHVSFKPAVWVSADLTRLKGPMIQGKLLEYETDYGEVIVEAKDDSFFHPSRHERFNVWMSGISTSAKLIMPVVPGGGIMGIELTNEMLMTILAVVLAVIILVAVEFLYSKLRSHPKPKSIDDQIRDLTNAERKIRGMKKNVQREYFKGLITSQAFNKMTMEYEEKLMGIISKKDDLKKKAEANKTPAPGK